MSEKNKKILIVEDEAIIAMELKLTLQKKGYDVVHIASSGDQAISYAQKYEPHIILMDILLRGKKTGIDAAREIYINQKIPIIFLTGNAHLLTHERLAETHSLVLTKPCPEGELFAMLEKISDCIH